MRVTIVGAGNMGRGIGTRAVAGGHQVEIVDRNPTARPRWNPARRSASPTRRHPDLGPLGFGSAIKVYP